MSAVRQMAMVQVGASPTVRTLRGLLEAAGEARRNGDRGLADLLETDAVILLRSSLQAARQEARHA
ncbi:MAG TPA: hypothetical protein VGN83_15880 [Falsiroseomonas sp.]|jgi:hypothetical protein|nr:hypothetical protein [Falsiroseomonas sp.]